MTDEQLEKIAWLNRAFHAEKKVKALGSLLERDKERAKDISANYEKNDKGRSDSRTNGIEEILLLLAESEEKYNKALAEYTHCRREIETVIRGLHNDELEAVLSRHYLNYETWEQVAENMDYGVRTVKYKHKKALDKFALFCTP